MENWGKKGILKSLENKQNNKLDFTPLEDNKVPPLYANYSTYVPSDIEFIENSLRLAENSNPSIYFIIDGKSKQMNMSESKELKKCSFSYKQLKNLEVNTSLKKTNKNSFCSSTKNKENYLNYGKTVEFK